MYYIHHHLGLGDHIVCNALVRHLISTHDDQFKLAVKTHNVVSVRQLYADTDQIILDPVSGDHEVGLRSQNTNKIKIGFENCMFPHWEKSFYDQLGVDYAKRYSDFYIQRNRERESLLLEKLKLPKRYAFASTKWSRGNTSDIKTVLPIVFLEPLTDSLFDWIPVIEQAEEIHTVDTSCFHLIKQISPKCRKVFYQKRAMPFTFEDIDWEVIRRRRSWSKRSGR